MRSARPDPDPTFPRPLLNYAVALLLGLLLGPLVAVVAQTLNTKVQGRRDLERLLPDVPLLGAIPADGATHQYPLITQAIAHSPRVEAFRTLRTNLQFLDATHAPRSVVVTSSIAGEGKTSVARSTWPSPSPRRACRSASSRPTCAGPGSRTTWASCKVPA